MRLFIAIALTDEVKNGVTALRDALCEASLGCTPTRRDNLHITLAFLGDIAPSRIPAVRRCMQSAAGGPFELKISRSGCFRQRDGELWWAGVERSRPLLELASRLSSSLSREGFALEDLEFSPHLTVARRVRLRPDFDKRSLPQLSLCQQVGEITLFLSERVDGVLTYTPLATVLL